MSSQDAKMLATAQWQHWTIRVQTEHRDKRR
jgi:hypothetical protein